MYPLESPNRFYRVQQELVNKPPIINSFLVLSARSWAIIRGVYIVKLVCPLHVHQLCDLCLYINYGRFINQFSPDIIKSMKRLERINTKMCRQRMFILFNEICINEEMPKYTHTHTHTHMYIYIYIYINMI